MAQVVTPATTTRDRGPRLLLARAAGRARGVAASATVVLTAGLVPLMASTPAQAAPAGRNTVFIATGGEQTYTVPADATSLRIRAVGAQGGRGGIGHCSGSAGPGGVCPTSAGGRGQLVDATVAVCADGCALAPGQTLYVEVGGVGATGSFDDSGGPSAGGFNGGGASLRGTGGGGGGASDVRTVSGSAAIASRLLVAGGGGGGGSNGNSCNVFTQPGGPGGDAGSPAGGDGSKGSNDRCSGQAAGGGGGGGATQSAGGAAGVADGAHNGCNVADSGTTGSLAQGGTGGFEPNFRGGRVAAVGGGGGGGGWYGGGGGAGGMTCGSNSAMGAGGGGGGSSYTGTATATSYATDTTGIPQVQILTSTSETATTVVCTPTPTVVNAATTCVATVSDAAADPLTPTGTVAFTSTGPGTFSSTSCSLVGGTCSVTFTPTAATASSTSITASYGGDLAHPSVSSSSVELGVNTRSTGVAGSCTAGAVGRASTCTAIVTDTDTGAAITPTGTISWTGTGGTFGATSCSLSGGRCSVTFTPSAVSTLTLNSTYAGDASHLGGATSTSLAVGQGAGSATISNLPASGVFGGSFTATYTKVGDGTVSLSSSTQAICSVSGNLVSYLAPGVCRLTASTSATTDYAAGSGAVQNLTISKAAGAVSISNIPTAAVFGDTFTPTYSKLGTGSTSTATQTPTVCSITGGVVSFVAIGACRVQASVQTDANYLVATGAVQTFTIGQAAGSISISNLPTGGKVGQSFTPTYQQVGSGTPSVVSSTPSVCTVAAAVVEYVTVGECELQARAAASTNHTASVGPVQNVPVTPGTASISIANLPAAATFGGSFTVEYMQVGTGTAAVATLTPAVCATGDDPTGSTTVRYLGVGTCTLQAAGSATDNWSAATGPEQSFTIDRAAGAVRISDLPTGAVFGERFSPEYTVLGDGDPSISSLTTATCVVETGAVRFAAAGTCRVRAAVTAGTNHLAAQGAVETIAVGRATGSISIADLPSGGRVGTAFTATYLQVGSGATSVTSLTPTICAVDGDEVFYLHIGTCELQAEAQADPDHTAATGPVQRIDVGQGTGAVRIANLPTGAVYGGAFTPEYLQRGDGATTTSSLTPEVCTVADDTSGQSTVSFVQGGICELKALATATTDWTAATGPDQAFVVDPAAGSIEISDLPTAAVFGGSFTPTFTQVGTGSATVDSSTPTVCAVDDGTVEFTDTGICTLQASAAATMNHTAATGPSQSFPVGRAQASISISELPSPGIVGRDFTPTYTRVGAGTPTTMSLTPETCSAAARVVQFLAPGTCELRAAVPETDHFTAATGPVQLLTVVGAPIVTDDPQDVSVTARQSVTFTASATGQDPVTVQWQVIVGGSWLDLPGRTQATLTFAVSAAQDGNRYRAVFTDIGGSTASAAATLSVARIPLVVTASSISFPYGSPAPAVAPIYRGFADGDTAATVVLQASRCSTPADASSSAGGYGTACTGGVFQDDYVATYQSGTAYVQQVELVLSGLDQTYRYGDPQPRLGYRLSGFVAGDTAAVVTGAPELTTTATPASSPGRYPVTVREGTLQAENYLFSITVDGSLTVTPAAGALQAIPAVRVLDTRSGQGAARAPVGPRSSIAVQITGRGGVPTTGVSSVVASVTVVSPTATGTLVAHAASAPRPGTASLNFSAGRTVTNLVVVPVDAAGRIRLYNGSDGTVQILVDVSGYHVSGTPTVPGTYRSVAGARLLDTRSTLGGAKGLVQPQSSVAVQVTGRAGVPATGVASVLVNVSVVSPTTRGFLAVYPASSALPATSMLNFTGGESISGLVLVPVDAQGKVRLFNGSGGTAHIVVDIAGWNLAGARIAPGGTAAVPSRRLLDTRTGLGGSKKPVVPLQSVHVQVQGRAGIPTNDAGPGASAVLAVVTVVSPSVSGYLTAFSPSINQPRTASLNFTRGRSVSTLVLVPLRADQGIQLYNGAGSGTGVDVLVDVVGYVPR